MWCLLRLKARTTCLKVWAVVGSFFDSPEHLRAPTGADVHLRGFSTFSIKLLRVFDDKKCSLKRYGIRMEKYSKLQVFLHWATFILVLFQFLSPSGIGEVFKLRLENKDFEVGVLVSLHIAVGSLIILFVFSRVWMRLSGLEPQDQSNGKKSLRILAMIVHLSMYGVLILLPITGGIAWFQLSIDARNIHEFLRPVLLVLILIHVLASLFHQFVQKDSIFKRMWF